MRTEPKLEHSAVGSSIWRNPHVTFFYFDKRGTNLKTKQEACTHIKTM